MTGGSAPADAAGAPGRYRAVLGNRSVLPVASAYVLARLSATMISLAVVLTVQARTHSFTSAGLLAGCFAAAAAVMAPVLGQLVDRAGAQRVLLLCGAFQAGALLTLTTAIGDADGLGVGIAAALVAGGFTPPVTACMRALWPSLIPAEQEDTGWALEGMIVEATELLGPLLVAGLTVVVSPSSALVVAAVLALAGSGSFALTGPCRSWRTQRTAGPRRTSTAPLRVRGVRRLVLVVAASTAALAALEVSVTGFATDVGHPGIAGVLFAIWLTGSLLGGWQYGMRTWPGQHGRRLSVVMALGGVTTLLPVTVALLSDEHGHNAQLLVMGAALAVTGLFIAPATAAQFAVLSQAAPPERRTESFTWASSAAFLGVAAGSAGAGRLVEQVAPWSGMVLSAVLTTAGAGIAFVSLHVWWETDPTPRPLGRHDRGPHDTAASTAATGVVVPDEVARQAEKLRHQQSVWNPPVAGESDDHQPVKARR